MEGDQEKKLIWVVFYGVSALGKTYFLKNFSEVCDAEKVCCQIISSDDCAKEAMDEEIKKNPSLTQTEAFEKTKKLHIKVFEEHNHKAVENMKPGNNIIVLDKVMNGGKFLKDINKTFKPKCPTRLVALIPWSPHAFNYSHYGVVPMSEILVANVCQRILTRDTHQTVDGTDLKKLFLALSFVKLYNGLKSFEEKKEEGNIEQFYSISFHQEKPEMLSLIPPKFLESLKKTLKELKPFQGEETVCNELLAIMKEPTFEKEIEPILSFGDAEQQKTQIKSIIESLKDMGTPK